MKMQFFMVLGILAMLAVPASAMLSTVTVPSGYQVSGIGNDGGSTPFDAYSWGFAAYDMGGNGTLDLLVDLGSVKTVGEILTVNRTDIVSNMYIWLAEIYDADEAAPGFDPTNMASYTTSVFGPAGMPPYTNAAGGINTADITDVSKRYFQIHAIGTYMGGNGFPVAFSDILTVVPEPATMCVFGLGSLFALKRRRVSQN